MHNKQGNDLGLGIFLEGWRWLEEK